MCGWEVWLGMHRREGGAGAPLSFCPSGPALFGRAGNLLVPAESFYGGFGSVSTVVEGLWRSHHEQVEVGKW